MRGARDIMGVRLTIKVNPDIAELLHGEESHLIQSLEKKLGKKIEIYPNSQFHLEQVDILEVLCE